MAHELTEALKAIQSLAEGATMRRRGLYEGSVLWQAFTVELEAYARVKEVLTQLNERKHVSVEFIDLGARTI